MSSSSVEGAAVRAARQPRLSVLTGLRNLQRMRRDPLAFLMEQAATDEVAAINFGVRFAYLVRQPEHIKQVLQENNARYSRQTRGYQAMRLALGRGLVTSEGDYWRRQRRTMQPAFHRERIAHLAAAMAGETELMLARWQRDAQAAGGEQVLDVSAEMMRLTLAIVGRTLFSTDISGEADLVGHAVTVIQQYISDRVLDVIGVPSWLPTPTNRRFRRALLAMDQIIYGKLAERRRGGPDPGDLLSMLMQARDQDTGEAMTDVQLRDESLTMIGAGHETTATALAWTFYLLAQHPAILQRLRSELAEKLNGRVPTAEDLMQLSYTLMVIRESMRLYPPVWGIARLATEEDELGGVRVHKGSVLLVSPYVTHRQPALFSNPEVFDPERFTLERTAQLPRFAYFPFGGGPHLCIGNNFALMEAQMILAMVVQRYDLKLVPDHPVVLEPLVTLRARHGLKMTVTPRRQAE